MTSNTLQHIMLHQQSFGWNLVQNTASYQHEEALLPPTQVGQGSATDCCEMWVPPFQAPDFWGDLSRPSKMQHFRNLTCMAFRCKYHHCIWIHAEELVLIFLRLTRNLGNAACEPLWYPPLPHSQLPHANMMQPGVNSTKQSFHIYDEVEASACGMGRFAVS